MSGFITSVPNLKSITFRDAIREISPRWLKRGLAEKLLYSFGLHLDVVVSAASEGVKKRFPELLDSIDALEMTGRGRKIPRGATEPENVYAFRMQTWLDDHKTRGGPYAMLQQLAGFWALSPFVIDLVYESGKRFHMGFFNTITESTGAAWDAATNLWARWWLVFEWPTTLTDDETWSAGPAFWDDGGTWDSNLTVEQVADIRLVPNAWNAGHTLGYVSLRNTGTELWDIPAGLWSDPGVWEGAPFTLTISVD